jgi:hypothetical protein
MRKYPYAARAYDERYRRVYEAGAAGRNPRPRRFPLNLFSERDRATVQVARWLIFEFAKKLK